MATLTTKPTSTLEPGTDVQVSLEDQQKINKFARQNMHLQELVDELERQKKELQNLEDASDELLMVEDEEAYIPFKIGEVYVNQMVPETREMIEEAKSEIQQEIAELNGQSSAIKEVLSDLKVQLYAKFGTNINLEPDAED